MKNFLFLFICVLSFGVIGQEAESLPVAAEAVQMGLMETVALYASIVLGVIVALRKHPKLKDNSILGLIVKGLEAIANIGKKK